MSYEEQLNQDAMELTEETAAEVTEEVVEETVAEEVEVVAEVEAEVEAEAEEIAVEAEIAPEEAPVEVISEEIPAEEEILEIVEEIAPVAAEEAAEELAVDTDLFDSTEDEELEIEFEIEEPKASREIAGISSAMTQAKGTIQAKYDEARSACKSVASRIAEDLEKTNYNPYIRTTTTRKYEILRNSKDTDPVDTFEFTKTSGFSLRAMAITSMIVASADVVVSRFLKKK